MIEGINNFYKLSVSEAVEKIKLVDEKLADILGSLKLGPKFYFYFNSYLYGNDMLESGHLHLQLNRDLVSIHHKRVNNTVREDLLYHDGDNPLFLLLNKKMELSIKQEDRVVPFSVAKPVIMPLKMGLFC